MHLHLLHGGFLNPCQAVLQEMLFLASASEP